MVAIILNDEIILVDVSVRPKQIQSFSFRVDLGIKE